MLFFIFIVQMYSSIATFSVYNSYWGHFRKICINVTDIKHKLLFLKIDGPKDEYGETISYNIVGMKNLLNGTLYFNVSLPILKYEYKYYFYYTDEFNYTKYTTEVKSLGDSLKKGKISLEFKE